MKSRIRSFVCFSAAFMAFFSSSESAYAVVDGTLVFDNGSPDFRTANVSDTDYPLQQAGDFVLRGGLNTITAVRFWGDYAFGRMPPATDDFKIRFFADEGDKPGVDWLFEFPVGDINRNSLGISPLGPRYEYFQYEAAFSAITLDPGKTYWLSILNSTEFDTEHNWYWARSSVGGYWQNRVRDGEAWDHPRLSDNSIHYFESAFQLIGVPEPSGLVLLLYGVAVMSSRAFALARHDD